MASVTLDAIDKTYADGTRAVKELSLDVLDGEFLVFVGPSGCGKTTALRMVAGLERITSGELRIDGSRVNDVEPRRRDIAMVFQNYALYPHMSVYDNIAFPLASQRMRKEQIRERVTQTAALLDLKEHLRRRPSRLSGGQRQRVAMGRALVRQPKVFLMDEPLSNLDAKLRAQMRGEIARLQRQVGVTTIYVTHDQVEAMTMGDRIAVMRQGVLQQLAPAQQLYDRPENLFVATFVGTPPMNLLAARVQNGGGRITLELGTQRLDLPSTAPAALSRYVGRDVALGIRPEHVAETTTDSGDLRLSGTTTLVETLGSDRLVHVDVDAPPVVTEEVIEASETEELAAGPGEQGIAAKSPRTTVIARFEPGAGADVGARQEIALRPDHLHFFDLETNSRID